MPGLYLAVHRVQAETAKVPLSMIILMDYVKRKSLPPDLKCRVVLPCGDVSVSVWDAPSQDLLQEWLDLNLSVAEPGLMTTCHEVQEDFSYGLVTVLAQARAAEKMVASSKTALDTISRSAITAGDSFRKQLEVFDSRTNLLTATGEAISNLRSKTSQAIESERVASAMSSFSAGITSAGSWFSKVGQSFTVPRPAEGAGQEQDASNGQGGFVRSTLPEDSMHFVPFSLHQSKPLPAVQEADEEAGGQSPVGVMQQQHAAFAAAAQQGQTLSSQAQTAAAESRAQAEAPRDDIVPTSASATEPEGAPDEAARATFVLSDDVLEMPSNFDAASPHQLPSSQPAAHA